MRSRNQDQAATLVEGLGRYSRDCRALPGVSEPPNLNSFVEQLIESIRRVQYVSLIRQRDMSLARTDPTDPVMFDPLRAAIVCQCGGEIEEAFWLVFLFVHFGKHRTGRWRYVREIYGRLGEGGRWDWRATSEDPSTFRAWLHEHVGELKRPGVPGGFGNHRKYESLDAYSSGGTGAVVESYVGWVMEAGTHRDTVERAVQAAPSAREAFDFLYQSMAGIARFGADGKVRLPSDAGETRTRAYRVGISVLAAFQWSAEGSPAPIYSNARRCSEAGCIGRLARRVR